MCVCVCVIGIFIYRKAICHQRARVDYKIKKSQYCCSFQHYENFVVVVTAETTQLITYQENLQNYTGICYALDNLLPFPFYL